MEPAYNRASSIRHTMYLASWGQPTVLVRPTEFAVGWCGSRVEPGIAVRYATIEPAKPPLQLSHISFFRSLFSS
jgi:hypothetical protein